MKKYIFILTSFIIVSCNFNKTYENREEDKKEAEKVMDNFYTLMKDNSRKEAFKLFSDKFFHVTDKEKLNLMFEQSDVEYGKIINYSLSNWETLIVKGSNSKSDYVLTYDVKRTKHKTQETFSLQKENNNIKIVGYRINYDILSDQKK